uniref:Uncharacterized protein n=1 Tax=Mandrillus leucophaeus TaxID=9568 RepID=A0A2K5Y9K6_MANLE
MTIVYSISTCCFLVLDNKKNYLPEPFTPDKPLPINAFSFSTDRRPGEGCWGPSGRKCLGEGKSKPHLRLGAVWSRAGLRGYTVHPYNNGDGCVGTRPEMAHCRSATLAPPGSLLEMQAQAPPNTW